MFDALKAKFGRHSHEKMLSSGATDVMTESDLQTVRQEIIAAIKRVYDPEIPVNVYDLGLIYDIAIDADRQVSIQMTLTAPSCPVAGTLPGQVKTAVESVPGVSEASVELVWDPPWSQQCISEAAQLTLGLL